MLLFRFFSLVSLVAAIENGPAGTSRGMTTPGGSQHIILEALPANTHKSLKRRASSTRIRSLEGDSYEVGTNVADYFVKDGKWDTGSIIKVDGDTYTIQWSNGKTENYDEDDLDEIVDNYDSKAYDSDAVDEHEYSYKVGTKVADYFVDDGGWSTGSILLTAGGAYMIEWTDGSTTRYDDDEIDEIVENYKSGVYDFTAQYSSGTRVADMFDDDEKWYSGSIVGYHDGVYTIAWEDGTTSKYNSDEIDEIVNNAKGQSWAGLYLNGDSVFSSLGAKIGIIFLVLTFAGCAYNRVLQRQRQQRFKENDGEESTCIVEVASYSDEPSGEGTFSDTPKIV